MLKLKCGECRNFLPFEKSLNPKGGCSKSHCITYGNFNCSRGYLYDSIHNKNWKKLC